MIAEVVSLEAMRERFGTCTPRRQFLFQRFRMIFDLLHETAKVKHVYVFGSFVAMIPSPNDVDIFVIMTADFTMRGLREDVVSVFTQNTCRIRYNADVFWVTEAMGEEQIKAALNVFSRNCMQEPQALLEVTR